LSNDVEVLLSSVGEEISTLFVDLLDLRLSLEDVVDVCKLLMNEENDQTRHPKCQINPGEENTTSNHNLKPSHYWKKSKSKSILNSINMKAIRTTNLRILGCLFIIYFLEF
jgi:hypothetical protein